MVTNSKYSKDDEGHGGEVNDCFLLLFLLLLFEVGTDLMKKKTLGKYPKQPQEYVMKSNPSSRIL